MQRYRMINRLLLILCFTSITSIVLGQSVTKAKSCINKPDLLDGKEVYMVVTKSPEYKDGIFQLYRDFQKYVKPPKSNSGLDGRIELTFVIDTVGQVRNLCFIRPDDEAYVWQIAELTNKINKWSPGELDGKRVNVRMVIPMVIEWR